LITFITTVPGTLVPGREFPHGCSSGADCLSAAARGTAAAGQWWLWFVRETIGKSSPNGRPIQVREI